MKRFNPSFYPRGTLHVAVDVLVGSLSEVARNVTVPVAGDVDVAATRTWAVVLKPPQVLASAFGNTTLYPLPLTEAESRKTSAWVKALMFSGCPVDGPVPLPVLANGKVHVAPARAVPVAVPALKATPRGCGPRPSSERTATR